MWLVGRPLHTADAPHEAIGKAVGLAVFASDALSSTAYATQEILVVLAAAGLGALHYAFPISVAIVALLAIVTISYEQTVALINRPRIVITSVPYQMVPEIDAAETD